MPRIPRHTSFGSLSRLEYFLFFLILSIASFWTWLFLKSPIDDAFVTLRYAQNFLHGHGLVFNIGDHVESYSSYLCQVMICAGVFLGVPGALFLEGQSIFFYFLTLITLTLFARTYFKYPYLYLCVPVLYIFSLANNIWAGLGLETMLFEFLLLSSLIFYLKLNTSRWQRIFVGVWCCLLCLSRPESVVYYLVLLVFELFDQWLVKKKVIISNLFEYSIGLLIFSFYLYSRWKYYGYWMPNTYYQKIGYSTTVWVHGIAYLKDFIDYNGGGILVFLFIIAHGILFRRNREWWLFLLVSLSFFAITILSGGNYTPFWRYALPCHPLLVFLIGDFFVGYFLFIKTIQGLWKTILSTSMYLLFGFILFQGSGNVLLKPEVLNFASGNRNFHAIAKFTGLVFKNILSSNQSISLNALPFAAYYYGGWAYDPLGLTDAHIAHLKIMMGHRIQSHEKGDGRYILALRPTVLRFEGNLDFVSKPIIDYPAPRTLYYISDIEIAKQADFKKLYAPYNIFIPQAHAYMTFFKLKNEKLRLLSPTQLDIIFKDTLGKNTFLSGSMDEKMLKKIVMADNYFSSTPFYQAYRTLANIVTLRGIYEK